MRELYWAAFVAAMVFFLLAISGCRKPPLESPLARKTYLLITRQAE